MTKNYFISMQKGFLALMSAALLFSCSQIEPFEMEGDDVLRSVNISGIGGGDCNEDCITTEESTWLVKSYEHIYDATAPAKKLKVDVFNTPTQIIYKINTENTTIKYLSINDILVINDAESTTYTHSVDLGEFGVDWDACDNETATILGYRNNLTGSGSGNLATINTSYDLIGVCNDCEDSFSYVKNADGTYTFTYISEEDIDNAELVFTFAQGVVVSGLDGWDLSNGVTAQKTQDITGCTEYEWTVGLVTTCSGGQPSANLWTDFKVSDQTKKGELENIVQSCE